MACFDFAWNSPAPLQARSPLWTLCSPDAATAASPPPCLCCATVARALQPPVFFLAAGAPFFLFTIAASSSCPATSSPPSLCRCGWGQEGCPCLHQLHGVRAVAQDLPVGDRQRLGWCGCERGGGKMGRFHREIWMHIQT